jgi:hypothetical protein
MPGGKTVSLSGDLAKMLDDEVQAERTRTRMEVSRGQVAASILRPELERRRNERAAQDRGAKRGKQP